MVYSYQVIKFQTISFVQGIHWSQSVGDKGILYKSIKDPYSKLIVQSPNGSKKLYHVPKDRTVVVTNDIIHFLGESSWILFLIPKFTKLNLYHQFSAKILLELNKKVFGNIITQEIIGSEPSITEIKINFKREYRRSFRTTKNLWKTYQH